MTVRTLFLKNRWIGSLISCCILLISAAGCATLGPRSISMGRAEYNEVINRTEDEQMLLSIVKGRYGETYSLLAVSGVAANVRFSGNANVDIGFGPESYYEGNLVPFSGGGDLRGKPHGHLHAGSGRTVFAAAAVPASFEFADFDRSFQCNPLGNAHRADEPYQ